ncbi:MAG: hypothetical protein R3C41_07020 [Calditrichia bacterium]
MFFHPKSWIDDQDLSIPTEYVEQHEKTPNEDAFTKLGCDQLTIAVVFFTFTTT